MEISREGDGISEYILRRMVHSLKTEMMVHGHLV